jgi:hypothetical protein
MSCCTLKYLNITIVHLAADYEAHKTSPVSLNIYAIIHTYLNTYTYLSIYNTCMLAYLSTYIHTCTHTRRHIPNVINSNIHHHKLSFISFVLYARLGPIFALLVCTFRAHLRTTCMHVRPNS